MKPVARCSSSSFCGSWKAEVQATQSAKSFMADEGRQIAHLADFYIQEPNLSAAVR